MASERLSPRLADSARRAGLGRLERRLAYRVPRFAVPLCWAVVGLDVACWAGLAFGGPGPARPLQALTASLFFLAPPLWYLWRFRVRSTGGVYVFSRGLAEAYGNRVKSIIMWRDVFEVLHVTESGAFRSQRKIVISARGNNGKVTTLTVYSLLTGFNEIRQLVQDHVAPTALLLMGTWPDGD